MWNNCGMRWYVAIGMLSTRLHTKSTREGWLYMGFKLPRHCIAWHGMAWHGIAWEGSRQDKTRQTVNKEKKKKKKNQGMNNDNWNPPLTDNMQVTSIKYRRSWAAGEAGKEKEEEKGASTTKHGIKKPAFPFTHPSTVKPVSSCQSVTFDLLCSAFPFPFPALLFSLDIFHIFATRWPSTVSQTRQTAKREKRSGIELIRINYKTILPKIERTSGNRGTGEQRVLSRPSLFLLPFLLCLGIPFAQGRFEGGVEKIRGEREE